MTRAERAVRETARRRALPYGVWECADGREVLFNRAVPSHLGTDPRRGRAACRALAVGDLHATGLVL